MDKKTELFLYRTIRSTALFLGIFTLTVVMALSASPIITNDIYLNQMTNSEDAFVLMNAYNQIRPAFRYILIGIVILYIGTVAYEIHAFIKNKKEK